MFQVGREFFTLFENLLSSWLVPLRVLKASPIVEERHVELSAGLVVRIEAKFYVTKYFVNELQEGKAVLSESAKLIALAS